MKQHLEGRMAKRLMIAKIKTQSQHLAKLMHIFWLFAVAAILFFLQTKAHGFDFSYQGRLTEPTGKPVEGPVALALKFYGEETGGNPILTVTSGLENVALRDGLFQVTVSLSNADYHAVFSNPESKVWVEIVNLTHSPTAPFPRQRVIMVPFAGKVPIDTSTLGYTSSGLLTVKPVDSSTSRANLGLGTVATLSAISSTEITDGSITNNDISSSAAISDAKLGTISTAGKVSGGAITSGTIGGSTSLNSTGTISVSSIEMLQSSGHGWLSLSSPATTYTGIALKNAGSQRWTIFRNNDTESGSNAGSDLKIDRFDDSGNYLSTPVTIVRSSGAVRVQGQFSGNTVSGTGATLNMNTGNVHSTNVAAGTITLQNTTDGGVYVVALTNGTGGNYAFDDPNVSDTYYNPTGPVVVNTGKHTLVTILRIGSILYVNWVSDYEDYCTGPC